MSLQSLKEIDYGPMVGADVGVWIFLAVMAGLSWLAFRSISKSSMRRLQRGGAGAETEGDRRRKKEARKALEESRKAEAAEEDSASGKAGKPGSKKRKGRGKPTRAGRKPRKEAPAPKPPPEPEKPDLLLPPGKSLSEGLGKTRGDGFVGRLSRLFGGKAIDEGTLDQIEEVLYTADIGVRTSDKLIEGLRKKLRANELSDESKIWSHLRSEATGIFAAADGIESIPDKTGDEPHVVLVIGVNGAGKTTTIGKLAHRIVASGRKVLIGAGDTFRAAAVDQLEVWANRVGAQIVQGEEGQDPSSVLFDAVQRAKEQGVDVVLLDTAGRLHTNVNLVAELKKVRRVVSKAQSTAPHEVILVLDATNGQNAIAQAHTFSKALEVTGITLTKLDGTAKGGVVLGICDELKVPIRWIGIGERTEDLRRFDASEFVDALFEGK